MMTDIKTTIRIYGDKVFTNFLGLNLPEDYIECESFTVISIDSLLVYKNNYYLQTIIFRQLWLNNCKQTTDHLGQNLSEN